ncbi:sugar transferase (PEP-CTERM/EpsH1 system associated) [Sphingomonas naasensis]|uniref:TIGR03087 family PEP-CTERM/XrtA system glycosyltransferase n=1 Tax=Sphingomonas naasensis TaxID=1344951 RepID=A0A4S1WPV4_9SPHN|nr:TIGR03087 family PEP-CTERM/XrtA system glycosyltransferase [Sphingomonas naasensis]NIJ20489.1 sugar transferase (PEP-CTERM/EpsH1 system associated) [Sphingomonas naasensis]TGX44585.1 TIGR03087 family PEP-CTERM/XrtA system glycosyltransferase [Sphingomonas naasensis]
MGDILFLAHRVPFPPDRGDKIRSFHMLRHLAARGRVHLAAFADDARDMDRPELAALTASRAIVRRSKPQIVAGLQALASGRPLSLTAFDHAAMRRVVAEMLAREDIDTIFVFSSQMAQYLPAEPGARVIMDFVDMDSAKFAAYAEEAKGAMRWLYAREAGLLQGFEQAVAARADASLFVSDAEAALFRGATGAERVEAIENGIDTALFDPAAAFAPVEAGEALIVFTGQMDYRPNIEAVSWFVEAILPRVRVAHPEARFAIVGRNPGEAVKALARHDGVTVTGEVADVRGWLAAAAVVVAPLKLARGIQNKVLEAMAMARPVVASSAAAEGIDHDGTIAVGATAADLEEAVNTLLSDREHAARLGREARARVIARYGWDARLAPLDALLGLAATQVAAA